MKQKTENNRKNQQRQSQFFKKINKIDGEKEKQHE